jgi:Rod binding domain-containing protein
MADAMQNMGDVAINQAVNSAVIGRAQTVNGQSQMTDAQSRKLDQTAQNFEGMFMTQMLQPMFDTVKVDPMFGGGHGEEVMRGFLVQEYGKVMAKGGHLGIASYIKKQMVNAQGRKTPAHSAKVAHIDLQPKSATSAKDGAGAYSAANMYQASTTASAATTAVNGAAQ